MPTLRPVKNEDDANWQANVIILLAGGVAEARYCGEPEGWPDTCDDERDDALVLIFRRIPDRAAAREFLDERLTDARSRVQEHWTAVERLGRALLPIGTLLDEAGISDAIGSI